MQRHPVLIPLSQEHQRLLFVCRYLKNDAAAYEGFPLETNAKLAYIVKVFQEVMVPHIQKEEYLFEMCTGHHPEIDQLIQELIREHQQISRMYSALAENNDMIAAMDLLARSLEEHIRKEERVLFEKIQAELPEILERIKWASA
ncbi:hemerythrin domain-containing protein [Chitinophaga pinensis]|uniref:Hemerythrin HHE cation binding domain protein n=1 Tax=Chitinophaga pinensis (strain ATCC 43595 / DSM 2588 / LMG 13176 / NBRC 15968 / NCIMB 11800 / UQM 2034) TaxID=485918 RepID=A0A979G9X9_CHIPD|nr:hemerythrin domain-containing protein [Chitinophaga pinensis]ACU63624.1 Hemerythrin HHE cation binding domain protein [Chitinophaga pinensis DSM 2588]